MKFRFERIPSVTRVPMRTGVLALLILALVAGCATTAPTTLWSINNPYESVDWPNDGQYKANFHTHTTRSDGRMHPHTVVDEYHKLAYSVLAITDHNEVTYPWTAFSEMEMSGTSLRRMEEDPSTMPETTDYEDRDPVALGMVAIQANELSRHHHMNSFFNDVNGTANEEEALEATAAKGGIAMLAHPGRYDRPVEWYVDLYQRYDHLFGLEVYNSGDRYNKDRELWDAILTQTMPDRPVWGYSNDDMHAIGSLGRNWSVMVLPELSTESVRRGMEDGISYFTFAMRGHRGDPPPVINSIEVNPQRGTIEIDASDYESIEWVSGGQIVHNGRRVNLNRVELPAAYLRAVLHGTDRTITLTQPFGISRLAQN